jgi:two-component system nitrogen regulation sensor histidine kinase NtrY
VAVDSQALINHPEARFMRWARRVGLRRKLSIGLALAAVGAGVATYGSLSGNPPYGPEPRTVLVLLLVDLTLLLSLGALVARRMVQLWVERRKGSAGSRLHTSFVAWFSIVAVAPAIIVAVFSALFFNLGIQAWFSERVRTALDESLAVAEAYTDEHRKVIRGDILAMAFDINRQAEVLVRNPQRFTQAVTAQAALRSLSQAIVFERSGRIVARAPLSFGLEFETISPSVMNQAAEGEVVFLTGDSDDRVRALIRLDRIVDSYLYVGRFVDPRVLGHVERTKRAVAEYERLEGERSGIEITFIMIFIVVALLLLMVAVWFGLTLATRFVRPISGLIGAAEGVSGGDLSVRVAEGPENDEMATLGRAFNRMTSQLESQRAELMVANHQLDERRRFTEAVLAGVSAGVIGLDREGRIDLPNRSAASLLATKAADLVGQSFAAALPEMAEMLKQVRARPERQVQGQIALERGGIARRLRVRVVAERSGDEMMGFVVTFDDITELESAQRTAAWADVARRIAHEIKNPLTPIRLSAERLKRRYQGEIADDPEVFSRCTDTIIRQVSDIGRMVDEFSDFARFPAPVVSTEDLVEVVRNAVFLEENAHPEIAYHGTYPAGGIELRCDPRQVGRALTNMLQNAAQAIADRETEGEDMLTEGRIDILLAEADGRIVAAVSDNGRGLPAKERERLTEPYVTTRARGTGLGLAIVRKIAEDHGAKLTLEDAPAGGARVSIVFTTETAPANGEEMVAHGL